MQKWKADKDAVLWTAEDGEWVEAEVAQQLCGALLRFVDLVERDVIRVRPSEREQLLKTLTQANAALAAADGDSHEDAQTT